MPEEGMSRTETLVWSHMPPKKTLWPCWKAWAKEAWPLCHLPVPWVE